LRGESQSAADYIDLLGARRSLIARMEKRIAPYDALVLRPPPTRRRASRIWPMTRPSPPKPARAAQLQLINLIDGCAISLRRIARARCRSG